MFDSRLLHRINSIPLEISMKTADEVREYMREYMFNRYHERMAIARERLGGKCVRCGAVDGLELDHIDASTKQFAVSNRSSLRLESFLLEVDKCQLLCAPCHLQKSIEAGDIQPPSRCGTLGKYKRGCRCEDCTRANREHSREYKRARRELLRQCQSSIVTNAVGP